MEERRGLTIKDLLIRLILIIIFIFLLIWLFPMPDLKPLNNQIFADNLDRMKDVAKSYYTVERLPKNINDYKKMTLKEMIDNKLILPLMDSNGKYCSEEDSYIQITKLENEYVIKVYLSCSDKQDYIIEHFGCYDICSDTCKMLETTTTTQRSTSNGIKTTIRKTSIGKVTTSKTNKIYEYQFVKDMCKNEFDKYSCPSGYYLLGSKCVKNGSKVVTEDAKREITNVTSTDTKDATAIVTSNDEKVLAKVSTKTVTSTINATPSNVFVDKVLIKTQTVTADKKYTYDVKGAVGTVKKITADYIKVQNYDIITATKYATSKWVYVSTIYSKDSSLAHVTDDEKVVLYKTESYPACDGCGSTVIVYMYFKYKKEYSYSYSCDNFAGYSLYDGNKCRKPTTVTKSCPSGYTPDGSVCSKQEVTYSCSSYGSDYKLDSSAKTCTKTIVSYSCPSGTEKTSDPKYCTKKIYGCPSNTTETSNGKCSITKYQCPSNTSSKTYTLSGTKCIVKQKVNEYECPSGTSPTSDEKYCVKTTTSTKYSCDAYPGYTLSGKKCIKTTTTQKVTYHCNKGYTLNGTVCFKTINKTDTKDAEKLYKVSCHQEYKWSTKTSIEGWSYTGNKRLLN